MTHKDRISLDILAAFLAVFFLQSASLWAQTPPDPPPGGDQPGQLEKAFREKRESELPSEKHVPQIDQEEQAPSEEEAPAVSFFVQEISVEGNTVISTAEIKKVLVSYELRTLTVVLLREAAGEVTKLYRRRGYVTSRAIIPPQKIDSGKAAIRVVEGRIGKIVVSGARYFRKEWIARQMHLQEGSVLHYQDVEKDLTRINRHPDIDVSAVLVKGAVPGTSEILLRVTDHFPIHLSYHFDNLGSKFIGRLREGTQVRHNNLLSLGDTLDVRWMASEGGRFTVTSARYVLPLNTYGTDYELGFTHGEARYGDSLTVALVSGRSTSFTNAIHQPLLRSRAFDLTGTLGFDFLDSRTTAVQQTDTLDRLRVLKVSADAVLRDGGGRTYLGSEFRFGFPRFLGGMRKHDPEAGRTFGQSQFFKWSISMTRVQKFFFSTVLLSRESVEMTRDVLLSSEQFRAGGASSVRGYTEGDYTGDYGFTSSNEIRMPFPFVSPSFNVPFTQRPLREAIQPIGFLDFAKGRTLRISTDRIKQRVLAGVGGGVRIALSDNMNARFDWAKPIGNHTLGEGEKTRFHFALDIGF